MDRTEWLERRRTGIGGSDVAAILGISKWRTPLDVYLDKIGEGEEQADNASMDWGRRLEPVIRQAYADRTGHSVECSTEMFRHPVHQFMVANVDGLLDKDGVLEIKTARSGADWGEEGTDEIPEYYLTQVMHYLVVTGRQYCDVAVLIGASDFRIYRVDYDPELAALIIEEEKKFWTLVESRTPPAPRSLGEMKIAFPISEKVAVEASSDISEALVRLRGIRASLEELKGKESELTAQIQGFMGTADTLTVDGQIACTWKTGKGAARLDSASLKAKMPDIYNQFLKTGAPIRRFTVKSI